MPDQKFIYILWQSQTFCAGTKGLEEALNAVKFLGWLKKFGPPQNILGPVKGQGITVLIYILCLNSSFSKELHQQASVDLRSLGDKELF